MSKAAIFAISMIHTETIRRRIGGLLSSIPAWLWIALVPALIARLAVAWSPVNTSFALSVPDDAYYYFTIACNIVSGYGATFDGLAPTNGFHPLWMALITPLWWLAGQSTTLPIHLALTLGALLDLVTMLGIWYLAKALTQQRLVAGLAVLAYAWNPYNLAASVNGMETSVSVMLLVWSLTVYWCMRLTVQPSWRSWLGLGVLWALLLLARTDYSIIIAPCALDLAWRQRHRLRHIWIAGLGGLLWLPWMMWNLATFGSLTQVSGKAYPYYLHAVWSAEGHSQLEWLVVEGRMTYGILANLARLSGFSKSIILLAAFAIYVLLSALLSAQRGDALSSEDWLRLSALMWPTFGAIGLLLLHGLVRWVYIPWYFVPSSILLVLWFAVVLAWLAERRAWWAIFVTGLFLVFQLVHGARVLTQGGMWAAQWQSVDESMPVLIEMCERFDTIGVSDSGYYGYYLPCRVVNLDGVVNNQAYIAIRQGRFRRYLDETGIKYVRLNQIIRQVVAIQEGIVPNAPPFASQSP